MTVPNTMLTVRACIASIFIYSLFHIIDGAPSLRTPGSRFVKNVHGIFPGLLADDRLVFNGQGITGLRSAPHNPHGGPRIIGGGEVDEDEEEVVTDFEDPDLMDFHDASKRQYDDYGHLRFGKRDFDDYGHMRYGRSTREQKQTGTDKSSGRRT